MNLLILSSALALVAAPDAAPSGNVSNGGATSPAPSESTNSAPAERQICRRIAPNTGSRLVNARRVCMTEREWREYERGN